MELKIPSPQSGGLLVSYQCSASCHHCYLSCSNKKSKKMKLEDIEEYMAGFKQDNIPFNEVHITGGEPFLDFNYLKDILDVASKSNYHGMGEVETNAFWAINDKICKNRLTDLAKKGLSGICISSDIFHQEFISLDNVNRLAYWTREILGKNSLRLRWPGGLNESKHFGEMDSTDFKEYTGRTDREFRVRLVGRGFMSLSNLLPKRSINEIQSSSCLDKMVSKGHYHIDPHRDLLVGIGCVSLGKLDKNKTISKTLSNINFNTNPIFHWLGLEGPKGNFLDYAKENGFRESKGGYVDKCHLCFDIRKWLLENNSDTQEIGPKEAFNLD